MIRVTFNAFQDYRNCYFSCLVIVIFIFSIEFFLITSKSSRKGKYFSPIFTTEKMDEYSPLQRGEIEEMKVHHNCWMSIHDNGEFWLQIYNCPPDNWIIILVVLGEWTNAILHARNAWKLTSTSVIQLSPIYRPLWELFPWEHCKALLWLSRWALARAFQ